MTKKRALKNARGIDAVERITEANGGIGSDRYWCRRDSLSTVPRWLIRWFYLLPELTTITAFLNWITRVSVTAALAVRLQEGVYTRHRRPMSNRRRGVAFTGAQDMMQPAILHNCVLQAYVIANNAMVYFAGGNRVFQRAAGPDAVQDCST